jgi:hypothetical protein
MSHPELEIVEPIPLRDLPDYPICWQDPAKALEERPVEAAMIGKIIARSASIDLQFKGVLSILIGANNAAAFAVFNELRDHQLHKALIRASKARLDTRHHHALARIVMLLKPIETQRNRLAHWLTGYVRNVEGSIALWDPNHHLTLSRERSRRLQKGEHIVSDDSHLDGGLLYTTATLDSLIKAYDKIDGYLYALRLAILPSHQDDRQLKHLIAIDPAMRGLTI